MFAPDTLMLLKLGPLGCTFLQYKVHLSMFHSSPTSKIWHISTEHYVHWDGEEDQVCIVQKSFPKGGQTLLSLPGTREKNFQRNYLTSRAVKFCNFFCTCSPSSQGQDPTVESVKKNFKNSFGPLQQEMVVFGVFFEKKGVKLAPLSWHPTCWRPVHVGARYMLAPGICWRPVYVGARYMLAPGICWRLVHVGTRYMLAPGTCWRLTCSRPTYSHLSALMCPEHPRLPIFIRRSRPRPFIQWRGRHVVTRW
jgi:hypothetical protein